MLNVKPLSPRERRFFIYFFACFFVFLLFPGSFYFPAGNGADGSGTMAIYLAIKNKLLFGRDFPGTHGPLAILGIRFPLIAGKWVYLLGDLYSVYILFTGFRLILQRHFHPAPILFLFCCVLINVHAGMESWYFILLLFFLLLFIQEPGRSVYLVHAGMLTVICFYIKANSGLLDSVLFLGVLGYALMTKKIGRTRWMLFVFGFVAVLFISAWSLRIYLPGCLMGGLQAMTNYDGATYPSPGARLSEFAGIVCPVVFLLYLCTREKVGGKVIGIFCRVILTVAILSLCLLPGHPFLIQLEQVVKFRLIPDRIAGVANYFTGLARYDGERKRADSLLALPNMYKTAVGDHPVDIMPMDAELLYWSGLRYWPRAPDFVFFTLDDKGGQLQWAEEGKQKLALLARYRSRGFVGDQLLLEKKELPRGMIKTAEDTTMVNMGEEIPVKRGSGLSFSRFFIEEDAFVMWRRFIDQPPPLEMVYTIDDGNVLHFPAFSSGLREGFILSKFVNSTLEFRLFMLSDGRLSPDVRSIRIQPVVPGGYKTAMKMITTWYRFAGKDAQQAREDSLALLRLTAGNVPLQPLTATPVDDSDRSIRFDLENFRDHGGLIRLTGWAIPEKTDNSRKRVKVLAKNGAVVYELPTEGSGVHGMPNDLKSRADAAGAGFSATLSRTQLPPGNYRVGLAVCDDRTGKGVVRYLDRYFDIEEEYRLRKTGRIIQSPANGEIKYNIDDIDQRGSEVRIRGWAILTNARAKAATNLILQDDTAAYLVNTTLQRREDIMGAYKDSAFLMSGFIVTLPRTERMKGVYHIGIEKIGPDGNTRSRILTSTALELDLSDSLMAIGMDHLPARGKAYGNFDAIKDEDDFFTLGGWALADTLHGAPAGIQIILTNEQHNFVTADVGQANRPDIAGKYRNDGVLNCGFTARIAKSALPRGRYQLGLWLHPQGNGASVVFLLDKFVENK
jgi:hypothetical protein